MVVEYADGGDLYQRILDCQKRGRYMKEGFVWDLAAQMVRGLKALHDLNIFHRDLKSANVFLCTNGCVKIGDFNVSKVAKEGVLFTQTGTPYYASPEVWKDQPYDHKSDIWSLGCVLYEAAALKPPFRAEDMQGLFAKVMKGEFGRLPRSFSGELHTFVSQMLSQDPATRPSCSDILSFPQVTRRSSKSQSISEPPSALIGTLYIPKNAQPMAWRLPAASYLEEFKPSQTEPDSLCDEDLSLPHLSLLDNHRGRQGLTPDARMFQSRAIDERKTRDSSDSAKATAVSPGRYFRKVLRDSYGGLKVVKRNFRVNSLSRPVAVRPMEVVEPSPKVSYRGRKLRYLNPYGKLPGADSQQHRPLKRLAEEDSLRRPGHSVSPIR